ncbi:MAG: Methyltransferase cognate corrinoid protein [Promethearchaeota archaeon]|nr:MAG: Methyltransferase cognate corrinoid protein [Candidatus Lokiarchaeota archaeon]
MTLIEDLRDAVIEGDSTKTSSIAQEIIKEGVNINDAIIHGLNSGMKKVSELYQQKKYFLPEIIVSADSLYEALEIFKPHMSRKKEKFDDVIVMGVVRGDIHDIGKNITKLFFEVSGYRVIDCGRNVKNEVFIDTIKSHNAEILALSTLMNPTLESIEEVIQALKEENLFDSIKILIGGAATSEEFAQKIGVIYCETAMDALNNIEGMKKRGEI